MLGNITSTAIDRRARLWPVAMRAPRHRVGSNRWGWGISLMAGISAVARPAPAQPRPVVLQAEVSLATPLPDFQNVGACEALRVHAPWVGSLGPRFGAARCAFAEQGVATSEIYTVSGGLSWRPLLHRRVRMVVEAEAGLGVTGGSGRTLLGGSIGVDVSIIDGLTVGPALRYQHLLAAGSSSDVDLRFATVGVAVGFSSELFFRPASNPTRPPLERVLRTTAPPGTTAGDQPDEDGDGVSDSLDPCPHDPEGARPEMNRRGCPDRDTDNDGVSDSLDYCTHVPAGSVPDPTRSGCPSGDTDHDGILDAHDECPTDPPGWLPDPARPGCALADRDHDLVPDVSDTCPETAGAPHMETALNGCPGAVRVEGNRLRLVVPLVFDIVRLRRASFPTLRELRSVLQALPQALHVTIVGHATIEPDPIGRVQLAEDRAIAVRQWLEAHDLHREHITTSATPPPGITAAPDPATAESVEIWLSLP